MAKSRRGRGAAGQGQGEPPAFVHGPAGVVPEQASRGPAQFLDIRKNVIVGHDVLLDWYSYTV